MINWNKLSGKLSRARIHTFEFDFGEIDGDVIGVQTVHCRELTFNERGKLFVSRLVDGKIDITKESGGLILNAEVLAHQVCKENGDRCLSLEEVREWPPEVVDRLASEILRLTSGKAALETGEDSPDPSKAMS